MCSSLKSYWFLYSFPLSKLPVKWNRLHCNRIDYILLLRKSATRASCGANVRLQQSDKLNCIYILAVMCWFIVGDLLQQQTCEKTCDFQTLIPLPNQENTAGANTVAVKRCPFICLRMLKLCVIVDWNSECIFAWREQTVVFVTHFCKVWFCTDFLSDRMPRKTQAGIDDISILKLNKTACWSFKNQHTNWTNPHFYMWGLDQLTVMNIPNSYNLSLSLLPATATGLRTLHNFIIFCIVIKSQMLNKICSVTTVPRSPPTCNTYSIEL